MGGLQTAIIGAVIAGVVGIIGFVIVQTVFEAQTTTGWGTLALAVVPIIAPIVAVVTLLGILMYLNRVR